MTVLSLDDIERVNLAIAAIYAERDTESFFQKIVPLLKNLLSSDTASYNEFHSNLRINKIVHASSEHHEVFLRHKDVLEEYLPTHPGFRVSSMERCTMLSDLVEPAVFRKSELYNEYYHHFDVHSQLFTELPGRPEMRTVLMLSRSRPDFTEKERFMLGLLMPHIVGALRNAFELQQYREKIAFFEHEGDFPALRTLGLTSREAIVLGWAAKGKSNVDIALILGISRRTVEKHFEHIYEKLGVETKMAAISVIVNTPSPDFHFRTKEKTL